MSEQKSNIILVSASRTVLQNVDILNEEGRKFLQLIVDVTVDPASASITPSIRGKDRLGKYYNILVGAPIAATGQVVLRVGPGMIAAANLVANDFLPRYWNFAMAVADTDAITYSVIAELSD